MKKTTLIITLLISLLCSLSFAGPGEGCETATNIIASIDFFASVPGTEPSPLNTPQMLTAELLSVNCINDQLDNQANNISWDFITEDYPELLSADKAILYFINSNSEFYSFEIVLSKWGSERVTAHIPKLWADGILPSEINFDDLANVFQGKEEGGFSLEILSGDRVLMSLSQTL